MSGSKLWSTVAATLLFAAAFGLGTVLLRTASPRTEASISAVKLRWLQDHLDEYDVLFVGNSMVYRHIVPSEFDARMAERGHPVRSFNLGAKALNIGEVHRLTRHVASLNPSRLRWVFVNLGLRWQMAESNFGTDRSIEWHEGPETALMTRYALSTDEPLGTRTGRVHRHWDDLFSRVTNRGSFSEPIQRLLGARPKTEAPYKLADQGFEPFERESNYARLHAERHVPMASDPESYAASVAAIKQPECRLSPFPPHRGAVMRSLRGWIAAAGAQPVFFAPPMMRCHYGTFDDGLDPVLVYGPREAPELYRLDNRFDRNHLSRSGASLFTRQLADDFADWLDAGRG
jgi:hypothetical protein